jgi:hypothetical protein
MPPDLILRKSMLLTEPAIPDWQGRIQRNENSLFSPRLIPCKGAVPNGP